MYFTLDLKPHLFALPETNSSHLKNKPSQKETIVFQPSILQVLRCYFQGGYLFESSRASNEGNKSPEEIQTQPTTHQTQLEALPMLHLGSPALPGPSAGVSGGVGWTWDVYCE